MHPLPEHLLARPLDGAVPLQDARVPLRAAISSLALGGAERIVLEWAAEALRRGRQIELAVFNRAAVEWPAPPGLRLIRRETESPEQFIAMLARRWGSGVDCSPVAAHLLRDPVLREFARHGIATVPVLHNAQSGWINDPAGWDAPQVPGAIACAQAVAQQARAAGCNVPLAVIRHRPALDEAAFSLESRRAIRRRLGVPDHCLLIGMIGAIKPQKNYPRALRVLRHLLGSRHAALVIAGGISGEAGMQALSELVEMAAAEGLAPQVKLPGFVAPVAPWLAAFDVLLNTSDYEGYSIATQEALAAGLPVVGTAVSGQVEDPQPGLVLLPHDADDAAFAVALARLPVRTALSAPQPRLRAPWLWSLALAAHLPAQETGLQTLFVTANLNAGGAQRSLVNLVTQLHERHALAVAVCSETTHDYFPGLLRDAGVWHFRLSDSGDVYDAAESLLARAAREGVAQLCFWNADPKLKLLAAKFAPPQLHLIDVSPGQYAFEEMAATGQFQSAIAYGEAEYRARLDTLVLKYGAPLQGYARHSVVIPNGVAVAGGVAAPAMPAAWPRNPRLLVSGRIAPSKHLETIIAAFARVHARHPDCELHIAGQAEPRHADYLAGLTRAAGAGMVFRGALPDLAHLQEGWSAQVVIGTHQGSPNAVLEAMAAGVPVIANDSGGTHELIDAATGWLLPEHASQQDLEAALLTVLADPCAAQARARAARAKVEAFSLPRMATAYLAVLEAGGATIPG